MSRDELLRFGRDVFMFHPDAPCKSFKELLRVAHKSCGHTSDYLVACSTLCEAMAIYIDAGGESND